MRGPRSLVVLLLIALGLGAYAYFVESKRDLTDPETRKTRVFTIEPGKIEEIEIHPVAGDATVLKKDGDTWRITAPVNGSADQTVASTLASTLETLDVEKPLEDNPPALTPFGLEPARFSVTFKVAGDGTPHRLDVGNKTATGSDLYARIQGQPKLFLIAGYNEDTFNRTTFDLRDKTALKFSRDEADSIRLEAPGTSPVALARKNGDWRLTAPVDAAADVVGVDNILNRASQAQMKTLVTGDAAPPTDAQLKTFGLDKPQLLATFGAGANRATLAIGGKKDDATLYARDVAKPEVFTVEASLLTDLKKASGDFRVKDVFAFKSFTAETLEITRDGKTTAFAKSKAPGTDTTVPDVWKETKPEAKDVNQTAITDLLNTLSSIRAEKFIDKAPTSGEEVIVAARSVGGTSSSIDERVTFRKVGSEIHAIKPNEPGAAVVPTADFEKALTQLGAVTSAK